MAAVDRSSKPSFTKGLFLGNIQSELVMPYPLLKNPERRKVDALAKSARDYLEDTYDPFTAEADRWVGDDTIRDLADRGLLGLFVDEQYGGQALSQTGY